MRAPPTAFYVLDGALTFELGSDAVHARVATGGFVAIPPNVVHRLVSGQEAGACFLNVHAPDAGYAGFLRARRDGGDARFDSEAAPAEGGGLAAGEVVVTGPDEGERIESGPLVQTFMGVLPQLSFAEWLLQGRWGGPDVHRHDRQVDSCYVVEGELDVTVDDRLFAAGPNTLASVPRGVRHTFSHAARGTTRVLNFHAPDLGFADAMRRRRA